MVNGILENPFDRDTKPYDEWNELIRLLGPVIPKVEGNAGKVLKVRSDETGTEYAEAGSGGTSDYNDLSNKPQMSGVTLQGNVSLSSVGAASQADLDKKTDKAEDSPLPVKLGRDDSGLYMEI